MAAALARHIAVIGGGIAGLAAAYRLQAAAASVPLRITLVEATDRLGGWVRTDRWGDVLVEAGPDSFLATKPAARALAIELGLGAELVGLRPGFESAFIARRGRLEPLPEGFSLMIPTRLRPLLTSGLLSKRGKLRLALDLLLPPRRDDEDESLAAFVRRRLGSEAYEWIAQPLLAGIYASDAEHLSLLATFPQLRELELRHGSLIRGALAQRRSRARSGSGSTFLTLRGGMGTLIEELVRRLHQVDVRLGDAASALSERRGGYRITLTSGHDLDADAVIIATPAYVTARLLEPLDRELTRLLEGIPYASTATVTLVYRACDVAPVARGRGVVVPVAEGREVTAVTWVANKFEGRAPPDLAPVRVFLGRYGREGILELPDDRLVELAREELRGLFGLRAEPLHAIVHRQARSIPQYLIGHLDRIKEIEARLAVHPGLFLIGAAYRGVGLPDCIAGAERAARSALSAFQLEASGIS
uniref:Coproporphyrinogen III oxidase n=2 Tax=Thermorudis TaxID=1649508 RepID=A0A831TIB7_9BACT